MLQQSLRVYVGRFVLALGVLAVSSCASIQVGSDYDRSASFVGYHYFTMMQRDHQQGAHNPLVTQRTEDAIRRELIAKGYAEAPDPARADFAVDFTIGSKERTDVNSYPPPYGRFGWGWGPGWWGAPYWGDYVDVRQYREGTLSIDIFDAKSHRPEWHGWAKKELNRKDIQSSEEPIRNAVNAVLARFPPNRSA